MSPQPYQTLGGVLDEHGGCNLKMAYTIRLVQFPNDILKQIQLVFVAHRFE